MILWPLLAGAVQQLLTDDLQQQFWRISCSHWSAVFFVGGLCNDTEPTHRFLAKQQENEPT